MRQHESRSTRPLLAAGVLAPLLFVGAALLEGATRPGYSAWRHAVSQLALGAQGWTQTLAFLVAGALAIAFAAGLGPVLRERPGRVWGPRLTAAIGAILVLLALFPIQPGLGYPPPDQPVLGPLVPDIPLHGVVHALAGTALFGCLSALCFVLARGRGRAWAAISIACGTAVAAFYVATAVVTTMDQVGVLSPAPGGLLQRVALFTGFGWMALLAVRLLSAADRRAPASAAVAS